MFSMSASLQALHSNGTTVAALLFVAYLAVRTTIFLHFALTVPYDESTDLDQASFFTLDLSWLAVGGKLRSVVIAGSMGVLVGAAMLATLRKAKRDTERRQRLLNGKGAAI